MCLIDLLLTLRLFEFMGVEQLPQLGPPGLKLCLGLRVGGDFSVLAYIVTQVNGVPEVERRKWPVNFSVQPENSKQDQRYMISFVFVFENSLPRLPDWGDVAKWTK